jgi:hypothetical protein
MASQNLGYELAVAGRNLRLPDLAMWVAGVVGRAAALIWCVLLLK